MIARATVFGRNDNFPFYSKKDDSRFLYPVIFFFNFNNYKMHAFDVYKTLKIGIILSGKN